EKMIHWICRSPFSLRRRRQIDSFRTGFDDQRRQVIDFHITQRVVRRSPDTVRFDNIPDERTLLPRQPNATRWALHPQILTLLRQPVGQNDLFVLVLKEHTIMRPLRQILGSRLERAVPVRIVTPVLDPQVGSAQERWASLRESVAGGSPQHFDCQLVDTGHIEPRVAQLARPRNRTVQGRHLGIQLTGEIPGERRQHNAWGQTIDRNGGLSQPNCAVDQDDSLACARSPGQTKWPVVSTLCPATLFWVQEDSPRFEVSAFGNTLELLLVLDFGEAQLRGRGPQTCD